MPLPAGFIPDQTPPGFIPNGPVPQAPGSVPSGFVPDTPSTQDMTPAQVEAEIRRQAQTMGLDPNVAAQVGKFESGYRTTATSPKGAYGPMQVMQNSAGGMDIRNPHQNITRGLQLWQDALRRANGDYRRAYSQYYNPGYVGAGPFGAAAPQPAAPAPVAAPARPSFAQRVAAAKAKKPQAQTGGGFGQFRNLLTQGINKVGDIARGIGQAEESVQNYWRTHPITLPLPGGHGIQITPQFAPPRGVNPEAIFPNPLDIAMTPGALRLSPAAEAEVAAERAGIRPGAMSDLPTQNVRQQQLPLTMTRPLSIPQTKSVTKLLGSPETRQQLLLRLERERRMGLPAGHVPGQQPLGVSFTKPAARIPKPEIITPQQTFHTIVQRALPGMTIEEPVFPRRLLIRQPETPAPVAAPAAAHAPAAEPPIPTGDWRAEVQQARTVDQKGQALFGHIAAVRARGLGYLQDVKLTADQQTQLTNLLHSPESPLVTGKWPGWVDAPTQKAITDQYTRYVNLWQQNRGIEPAEVELATGHVPEPVSLGPDGRPFFPRMNVRQSLESEDVAGLRGIRQRVGPRRYFAAEINGQEQLVVVKKGQAFLRDAEGKLTPLGSVPKPQPGALIHTAQGDVPLRTPSAEMLRRADPTSIIDHPVYVLNQRVAEQEWIAATDAWKKDIISGKYPDIIQPATAAPEGWVESPLFGKAWRVDPLLAKVLQRVQQGRAGQARWNVLNNLYISTWFRTFPWGHNYNIAADAAVAVPFERAQLLAKGQLGDVLRAADTEVNTFGLKYQRALELGMAPQHVTVQSRRVLSGILRELGQDPQVRGGLLGNIWGKLGDYQESVPWVADAKARMKVILILEKTGVPFEDAVKQANELIANYWLPSFYAAPAKQLQPLYDAAHAAFTNPSLLVFSPYHGTRMAGTLNMLKGQLGVRGYTAVAGSILSTELVQRALVPAIAGVAITYWRNKAAQATTRQAKQEAQFQEHRWQRLHVSMPGRAGMLENIGTGLGLMGSALGASRGQPLSEQLSTLGAVARPAAQYMARGALTPSPALAGGAQLYDVMAGSQPVDLNALNPLQRYMHLAGDTTGEQALAAVLNQVVRAYPRYYLPSEYVASNYAKRFIQVGSKYKVAKQDMGVLHNLNLVAGRDLFKEGLLKPGVTPQMYADRLTRWETHRTVYPYQRGGGVRRPRLETQ